MDILEWVTVDAMGTSHSLDAFLNPESVAVVGASDRPLSWGCFIIRGLLSAGYEGKIYPVNPHHSEIRGIETFGALSEIEEPVDLAVLIVPEHSAVAQVQACVDKGVRGITLITAGMGEASDEGKNHEQTITELARSNGIRLLGPNVSGTFNLHKNFNASSCDARSLKRTGLAGICQGAWAFHDILTTGSHSNMGIGKLIQTGNEADITAADFLDYFADDQEVQGIIMHLESIKDLESFAKAARRASNAKPVIVFKTARTVGGKRASAAHTGGDFRIELEFDRIFADLGLIVAPCPELLLPLSHALTERPLMKGNRVGIVTMGASWGVALTDALETNGLEVREFSRQLQQRLRSAGLPLRASSRNPIDFGASGQFGNTELLVSLGDTVLDSGEVDALILHGIGRPQLVASDCSKGGSEFVEVEKTMICRFRDLEKKFGIPVTVGNHYLNYESPAIREAERSGVRVYHRLDDLSKVLLGMRTYASGISGK